MDMYTACKPSVVVATLRSANNNLYIKLHVIINRLYNIVIAMWAFWIDAYANEVKYIPIIVPLIM